MRHRSGSALLCVAVTLAGVAATACNSGGSRGGTAPGPQAARPAYVAPSYAQAPAPAPRPAYVAPTPAPAPVAYAGPSHGGTTAYLFLASWCGYCQKLERNTLGDRAVQAEMNALNARRVNPDTADGRAMAARYGVAGFPTTVVVDGNGNVVKKIVGYQDPSVFAASLRSAR